MNEMISCLKDADCSPDLISDVCRLCENGDEETAVKKLRRHRSVLMDELHVSQRKIDCLDFLLREITKSRQSVAGAPAEMLTR